MSRHVGVKDIGGQVRLGSVTSKRLEIGLRVPLLVNVHPTGLEWIGRHDEVPTAWRTASPLHRFPRGSEEHLTPLR